VSTETDTPRIVVGSFMVKEDGVYLRAKTADAVEIVFKVDPIALAIMSLTMDTALRYSLDKMKDEGLGSPLPPVAPDSPEGLEG
jgi:hypothetical protein